MASLSGLSFIIDGSRTVSDLTGNVTAGGHVLSQFTVAPECTELEVSLASYSISSAAPVLFDSATGIFSPGAHTLAIDVPACGFEVYMAFGGVLNPLGAGYGSKLIDSDRDGSTSCETRTTGGNPPETKVKGTKVLNSASLRTAGSSVEPAATKVLGIRLARTGSQLTVLFVVAIVLIGTGLPMTSSRTKELLARAAGI